MDKPSPIETILGLLVVVGVGAQTWVMIDEASEGEAARVLTRCWVRHIRPAIARFVTWADAHAIVERMIEEEITPILREAS